MIYIDMDGVLAKWDWDASLEDTFQPGYFARRIPEKNVVELIKRLKEESSFPVTILSAVYTNGYAAKEKRTWLDTIGLSDTPAIFVPYGQKKEEYVEKDPANVLIDDFSQNLRSWENAGFTGIKFFNERNGSHGTWNGYSIKYNMQPVKMAVVVEAVAKWCARKGKEYEHR